MFNFQFHWNGLSFLKSFRKLFLQYIHSVQKIWTSVLSTSPYMATPPAPLSLPLYLIYERSSLDIIRNKHKNKFMMESYFFMFRRLQNNITYFFKQHFYTIFNNLWLKRSLSLKKKSFLWFFKNPHPHPPKIRGGHTINALIPVLGSISQQETFIFYWGHCHRAHPIQPIHEIFYLYFDLKITENLVRGWFSKPSLVYHRFEPATF